MNKQGMRKIKKINIYGFECWGVFEKRLLRYRQIATFDYEEDAIKFLNKEK